MVNNIDLILKWPIFIHMSHLETVLRLQRIYRTSNNQILFMLQEDIEVGEVRIKHKKTEDEKKEILDNIEDKK